MKHYNISFRRLFRKVLCTIVGLFISSTAISIVLVFDLLFSKPESLISTLAFALIFVNFGVCYTLSKYAFGASILYFIVIKFFPFLKGSFFAQNSWLFMGVLTGTLLEISINLQSSPACTDSIGSWWCLIVRGIYVANPFLVIIMLAIVAFIGGRASQFLSGEK